MCLIIFKKRTVSFNKDLIKNAIETSFVRNSDSLGFMIKRKDVIEVSKGHPDPEELLEELFAIHDKNSLDKIEVCIHLRNASPGTAININTAHPICSNFEENVKEKFESKSACLVHNGAFQSFKTKMQVWKDGKYVPRSGFDEESDTTLFVKEYFSGNKKGVELLSYIKNNHPDKISDFIGYRNNKIVVFKPGIKTLVLGEFIKSDEYMFSNDSFKVERPTKNTGYGYPRNYPRNYSRDGRGSEDYSYYDGYSVRDTDSVKFDQVHVKHLSRPISNSQKLYSVSHVPFGCVNNPGKCSFKFNEDNKHTCCANLDAKDDMSVHRKAVAQSIMDCAFEEISEKDKSVLAVLETINKNPDKLAFYWHKCNLCKGDGYTTTPMSDCGSCKGLGLKLGIILKYNNINEKIYSEVTVFTVRVTSKNSSKDINTSTKFIAAPFVISKIIKYAERKVNKNISKRMGPSIY